MGVIKFNSPNSGKYPCFSNSFLHKPLEYVLPVEFFDREPVVAHFSAKPIMLARAAFFGDERSYQLILNAKTPRECLQLGQLVIDFDESLWEDFRDFFVYQILLCKFSDPKMKHVLMSTGDNLLAEASMDQVWGTGIVGDDVTDPAKWVGRNEMGDILMRIRAHFGSN